MKLTKKLFPGSALVLSVLLCSSCQNRNDVRDSNKEAVSHDTVSKVSQENNSDLYRADSLFNIKNYEESYNYYKQALKNNAQDSSYQSFQTYQAANIRIGTLLFKTGRTNEAISFLDSIRLSYNQRFHSDSLFNSRLLYDIAYFWQSLGKDSVVLSIGTGLIVPFESANDSEYLNKTYWLLGYSEGRKRNLAKALGYYLKSNRILERFSKADSIMLLKQYLTILGVYSVQNNIDSALHYLDKAESLPRQLNSFKPSEKLKYYYNSSNLYSRMGAYDRSILNCSQAVLNTSKEASSVIDAYPYSLMGQLYQEMTDYEKAISYLLHADSLFKMFEVTKENAMPLSKGDYITIGKTNLVLSTCYHTMKNYSSAIHYAQEAYKTGKTILPDELDYNSESCYNFGYLYYYSPKPNLDSALFYLNDAQSYLTGRNSVLIKPTISLNLESLRALVLADRGDMRASISLCDSVYLLCHGIVGECNKETLQKTLYVEDCAEAFGRMADCYLEIYKDSNNNSYLSKAEKCSNYQLAIINYSISNSDPLYATKYLNMLNNPVSRLLEINFEKRKFGTSDLNDVAGILENYKSVLLQQQQRQKLALDPANDSSRMQLLIQRTNRTTLLEKGADELDADPALKAALVEVNKKIESINGSIFTHSKQDIGSSGSFQVNQLIKTLPPEVFVLNYKCADNSIFVLGASREGITFNKILIDSNLTKLLSRFSQLLRQQEPNEEFLSSSAELFKVLVGNNLASHAIPKSLIIIPDEELNFIPFESLVINFKNDSISYLGDECMVRYEYCMSFLTKNENNMTKTDRILALAPKFQTQKAYSSNTLLAGTSKYLLDDQPGLRAGLGPLKYNVQEVEAISSKYSAKNLLDQDATEKEFRKDSKKYQVLHFATHAFSNANNPNLSGIVLKLRNNDSVAGLNKSLESSDSLLEQDNILHAYEIQNMDLNADLVVLSACETNIGKYKQGEGAMSLARAFKYANCPNIVSSLWKVNDASTKEIMTSFYDNLGKGMGKGDALALAKRAFRKEHPDASPFYWAPFILIGDNEPVPLKLRTKSFWWYLIPVPLILIGVWFFRRNRNKVPI